MKSTAVQNKAGARTQPWRTPEEVMNPGLSFSPSLTRSDVPMSKSSIYINSMQCSNYSIIYEGPYNMASDSEPRNFCRPPMPIQKSHFGGSKGFSTAISAQKNLQIPIKYLQCINNGWSSCNFRGPFTGPLNLLQTDVSRGPPGLSEGPGPLGPHRNSTTDNMGRRKPKSSMGDWIKLGVQKRTSMQSLVRKKWWRPRAMRTAVYLSTKPRRTDNA